MAKAEYRSAIRSRKLIQTALVDLLQEKPLEKITVTDVVNRAEINRGTFYAHYKDIPDMVNQMIQQTFSTIREGFPPEPRPLTEVTHVLLKQVQTRDHEKAGFIEGIRLGVLLAQEVAP